MSRRRSIRNEIMIQLYGYRGAAAGAGRSADRIATEKRHLKRKWKAHITFENYKSQDKVAMHVPRRQSVALS
jgi:hypothetical protein